MVILCGLKGSGKSTLGSLSALALGLPFIDSDDLFKQNPREIYRKSKEEFIREENLNLQSLDFSRKAILSLGGGTLENPANRELLKDYPTVYLMASFETLYKRMEETSWPAWLENEKDKKACFSLIYKKRNNTCLSFCKYRLELNDCVDKNVHNLVSLIGGLI